MGKQTPESALTEEIRLALAATGKCVLHRLNSGVAMAQGGHYVRFGLGDGAPDLVGWIIGSGRLFALEVKTPTGRVRTNQKAWIDWANKTGAFACVVRSVDDALKALQSASAQF